VGSVSDEESDEESENGGYTIRLLSLEVQKIKMFKI
jgi:hypothetical protein